MSKKKNDSYKFLILTFFCFLSFGLEFLILNIESIFYDVTFKSTSIFMHWSLVIIAWCITSFILYFASKKILDFDILNFKDKISFRNFFLIILILIISVKSEFVDGVFYFKAHLEYLRFIEKMGGWYGNIAMILQHIYYASQSFIILFLISFGHEFCERKFRRGKIPWGGILFGFVWFIVLYLSTNNFKISFSDGFMIGLFSGLVYLLAKKNPRYSYIAIYLIFAF
ncbi:MAG: hypothetical protein ACRCSK_06725 [Fusobacteriaceae bacterium]